MDCVLLYLFLEVGMQGCSLNSFIISMECRVDWNYNVAFGMMWIMSGTEKSVLLSVS